MEVLETQLKWAESKKENSSALLTGTSRDAASLKHGWTQELKIASISLSPPSAVSLCRPTSSRKSISGLIWATCRSLGQSLGPEEMGAMVSQAWVTCPPYCQRIGSVTRSKGETKTRLHLCTHRVRSRRTLQVSLGLCCLDNGRGRANAFKVRSKIRNVRQKEQCAGWTAVVGEGSLQP